MYSVVLMMSLATGYDMPECHRRHGCRGGGYGGCHGGCYGGGYGGCHGGGYGGCYGGYGGCYGGYSYGGCYGGYGMVGGYSNQYPKGADETDAEYNYCVEQASKMPPAEYANFRSGWLRKTHAEREKTMKGKDKGKGPDEESSLSRPAQIVVSLPADARLTFDGQGTGSAGAQRTFLSPPLSPDSSYWYTVKAEFVREGKTVSIARRVAVAAGKETRVSFDEAPATSVASR
jgi:uncharacterized protein (TIGR03000 family)